MLAWFMVLALAATAQPVDSRAAAPRASSARAEPAILTVGACVWDRMGPERRAEVVSAMAKNAHGWPAAYGVLMRPDFPMAALLGACEPDSDLHPMASAASTIGGVMRRAALVSLADRGFDEAKLQAVIAGAPEIWSGIVHAASGVVRNGKAAPVSWLPLLKAAGLKPGRAELAGSTESYVIDWAQGAALEVAAARSIADATETDLRPLADKDEPVDWATHPTAGQIVDAYPPRAAARGLSGSVVIHCTLTRSGETTNCWVKSETPAGFGFGEAGLHLASMFTFRTASGRSPEGKQVEIPINWRPG